MRLPVGAALITLALGISAVPASAGNDRSEPRPPQAGDCTPVNGPHGFYGNPWCDGWEGDEGRPLVFNPPWSRESQGAGNGQRAVRGTYWPQ